MVTLAIFTFIVVVMICGGMLVARLGTAAKSKGSWIWGCVILIVLISIPLFLLGLLVWFIFSAGCRLGALGPLVSPIFLCLSVSRVQDSAN